MISFFDEIAELPKYKYSPGRWWAEKLLSALSIVSLSLTVVLRHRPLLLILMLALGIGLLVYSFIYHKRTMKAYEEIRDSEIIREAEQIRKKRGKA